MNSKSFITIFFISVSHLIIASIVLASAGMREFYYFRGQRIPLLLDSIHISVAYPHRKNGSSNINKAMHAQHNIRDSFFRICVFKKSELNDLSWDTISKFNGETSINNVPYVLESNAQCIVQPCYKTAQGENLIPSPYLYVRLKNRADIKSLNKAADSLRLSYIGEVPYMPMWHKLCLTPESPCVSLQAANILHETGWFEATEADLNPENIQCFTWDDSISAQWALHNAQHDSIDINICKAWNYATGWGVKIAIIDSGVDTAHPDLCANIAPISFDTENGTSPSLLYNHHGTHCAGIAAAVRNNGIGMAGVAPDATLVPVSLGFGGSLLPTDTDTEYPTANVTDEMARKMASGIKWATRNGADVISCSWSFPYEDNMIAEAIDTALIQGRRGRGCVTVFAAGNIRHNTDSLITYPADSRSGILTVGALDDAGLRSDSSRMGPSLDVMAPGMNIYSTLPRGRWGRLSGTSMACPHVAGLAALVIEINPDLTASQVTDLIEQNTRKIGPLEYRAISGRNNGLWNPYYGYGLIDAYKTIINTPLTPIAIAP